MAAFKIALRSLMRRKVRMILIGFLVMIGSVLITFGGTFVASAKAESQSAIIETFTGDVVIYSDKSKELPSPFAFTSILPVIQNQTKVMEWINRHSNVESAVAVAQNYAIISVEQNGKTHDLPFIFYAVDPTAYDKTFHNLRITNGKYFQNDNGENTPGIIISNNQLKSYLEKYDVTLAPGDKVKLLSLTSGGAVNAVSSTLTGIFDPIHYSNVFNYINFMDNNTYSQLFNFTGIDSSSLPDGVTKALKAETEDDIFNLAGVDSFAGFDTGNLKKEALTGYSSISVKLKNHEDLKSFIADLKAQSFGVNIALWNQAAGFFASIADILQGVILGITLLIFLIVVFILMNTFIINILERTGEIGTLRAIGADKSFVSAIFLWESVILNVGASGVGAVISLILTLILGATGINLPEIMSQYLIGGGTLQLSLTITPFITGFILVLFVSFFATLYPTRVAASVSPMKAMSSK